MTGLVVGTIGLAALFQTCIELFERFELGRNHVQDYQLACTKVDLLQARLAHWGEQFRVEVPGKEHPALRHYWTHEQAVIARSLVGIKDIFESASVLAGRYSASKRLPTDARHLWTEQLSSDAHIADANSKKLVSKVWKWTVIGKRTIWAVRDKSKLDNLIDDLSFLIDNLDKVGARIAMSSAKESIKRKSVPVRGNEQPDKTRQPNMSASRNTHNHSKSSEQSTSEGKLSAMDFVGAIGQRNALIHLDRSSKTRKGAVTLMGNTGKTNTVVITQGDKIDNSGLTVLGNVDRPEELVSLYRAQNETVVSEAEVSDSSTESDCSSQETLQDRPRGGSGYPKRV